MEAGKKRLAGDTQREAMKSWRCAVRCATSKKLWRILP